MKILIIILTSLFVSACSFTTNPVTEIGARIVERNIPVEDITDTTEITLYYSSMHKYRDAIFSDSDSFSIYSPMKPDWVLGRVKTRFNYSNIVWVNDRKGFIELNIEGKVIKFDVEKRYKDYDKEYIAIFHEYRTWYGYPAQVLLIAAIPIDLAINFLLLPITIPLNIMF